MQQWPKLNKFLYYFNLAVVAVAAFGALYCCWQQDGYIIRLENNNTALRGELARMTDEANAAREALIVSYHNQCLDNVGEGCDEAAVKKFARFEAGLTGRF